MSAHNQLTSHLIAGKNPTRETRHRKGKPPVKYYKMLKVFKLFLISSFFLFKKNLPYSKCKQAIIRFILESEGIGCFGGARPTKYLL